MRVLQKWRERTARPPSIRFDHDDEPLPDVHWLAHELEEGLRDIDYAEVTLGDRITFVEAVVAWQVRRALHAARFDLALELQRCGAERVARLHEEHSGWCPLLLYGAPRRWSGEA